MAKVEENCNLGKINTKEKIIKPKFNSTSKLRIYMAVVKKKMANMGLSAKKGR